MTRATLYARYSTDKQRETSIADQLRAAQARCEREGWPIVATHADEGVSGSTPVALRRGGKALLADALAKRFDVLVCEGLDRISRDIGEAEQLVKRIEHRGIRIIGTSDGYDTEAKGRKVMRIARGLVNELYLDDLREKTHRGQAGQFSRGYHVGGVVYGYRSEPSADGRGRCLVIDEAQAATVRWIFEQFADGHSTRALAHQLNDKGVPSPRGGTWAVSCLQGSSAKGLGLINAEIYLGRVTWNRRQWIKDPDTGRRRYVERPREEWQVREQPELRIISDALWQRVRDRQRKGSGRRIGSGASPRTLFGSGVLRCAACGGAVVAINALRYGCSARKDRGPSVCPQALTVMRDALDKRLIAELRAELLTPSALAELQREVRAAVATLHREQGTGANAARTRLAALQGQIGRLVDAVASVGISAALQARLQAAEAERAELEQLVQHAGSPPPTSTALVADVTARYRRLVLQLQQVLEQETDRDRTRAILADMIGTVVIGRDQATGEPYADLEEPAERLMLSAVGESLGVVAGARFRPTRRIWLS
jgi:DNA invertase Pin-like site-specific DNA recombinase